MQGSSFLIQNLSFFTHAQVCGHHSHLRGVLFYTIKYKMQIIQQKMKILQWFFNRKWRFLYWKMTIFIHQHHCFEGKAHQSSSIFINLPPEKASNSLTHLRRRDQPERHACQNVHHVSHRTGHFKYKIHHFSYKIHHFSYKTHHFRYKHALVWMKIVIFNRSIFTFYWKIIEESSFSIEESSFMYQNAPATAVRNSAK